MGIPVRLPDGKIILIDTTDRQAAAAAAKKYWGQQQANTFADKVTATKPAYQRTLDNSSSVLPGGSSLVDSAMGAGGVALANALGGTPLGDLLHTHKQDFSSGQMFQAMRTSQARQQQKFQEEHPWQNAGYGLLGALMNPANREILKSLGTETASGGLASRMGGQMVRSGATGGALGAFNGAALSTPGNEVADARNGGMIGGAVGAAVPAALGTAGAVVNGVADTGAGLFRAANNFTGNRMVSPARSAAQKYAADLAKRGVTGDALKAKMNEFLTAGVEPSMIDLTGAGSLPVARVRGFGVTDPGSLRDQIMEYAAKTRGKAAVQADMAARDLTPNTPQTAPEFVDMLKQMRRDNAKVNYPASYGVPVETAPIADELRGATGTQGINYGLGIADSLKQWPQVDELTAIRNNRNAPLPDLPAGAENLGPEAQAQIRTKLGLDAPQIPASVDLGTLDSIKRGLFTVGDLHPEKAAGATDRAKALDEYLANLSDDYAKARDTYHADSQAVDAVPVGQKILNQPTAEFAPAVGGLANNNPAAQTAAQVGGRQAITDDLARTSPDNIYTRLRNYGGGNQGVPQFTENLKTLYPEGAAPFQDEVSALRDKVRVANSVDPFMNSRTTMNASDAAENGVKQLPTTPHAVLHWIVSKLNAGMELSAPERQAYFDLAQAPAQSVMPSIFDSGSKVAGLQAMTQKYLPDSSAGLGLLGSLQFSAPRNQ
jgi:hypothetical protein